MAQRIAAVGSTRPGRITLVIADWLINQLRTGGNATYEILDLADGFVFVFQQYNWGCLASLKNALDFVYDEWAGKPGALVRTRGGGGRRRAAPGRRGHARAVRTRGTSPGRRRGRGPRQLTIAELNPESVSCIARMKRADRAHFA